MTTNNRFDVNPTSDLEEVELSSNFLELFYINYKSYELF